MKLKKTFNIAEMFSLQRMQTKIWIALSKVQGHHHQGGIDNVSVRSDARTKGLDHWTSDLESRTLSNSALNKKEA